MGAGRRRPRCPVAAAAEAYRLRKNETPPVLSVRFQSPDLDVDCAVSVQLGTGAEGSSLVSMPALAADLIKLTSSTLQEYGHDRWAYSWNGGTRTCLHVQAFSVLGHMSSPRWGLWNLYV